jgi:hypothetical protein
MVQLKGTIDRHVVVLFIQYISKCKTGYSQIGALHSRSSQNNQHTVTPAMHMHYIANQQQPRFGWPQCEGRGASPRKKEGRK